MNSLSSSAFSLLILPAVLFIAIAAMADPSVSIIVRDATNGAVTPIELPYLATIQDLHDALVEIHTINTTECKIAISYHGEQLNEFGASLADTGISMQSVVGFNVIPLILLQYIKAGQHSGKLDEQDTIRWDPSKDLTQIACIHRGQVAVATIIVVDVTTGKQILHIVYSEDASTVESHSFWIVRTEDVEPHTYKLVEEVLENEKTRWKLQTFYFRQPKFAQDMVVLATPNRNLALAVTPSHTARLSVYRIPDGYSVLLKHKKNEYEPTLELQLDEAVQIRHVERSMLIDTKNDVSNAGLCDIRQTKCNGRWIGL